MFKKVGFSALMCILVFNLRAQHPPVKIIVDLNKSAQTIENFGASGCWFSEGIGKFWPSYKKERIAQLLFSKKIGKDGQLEGIGLSAWRFNIGAGTSEQGDSSGIRDFRKRTDSFLKPDGSYDWTKQKGQRFFLQKAHDFGVETLIAFSNSPPVQFTKNGLGFKTEKDYVSNLKADYYNAYANFLTDVTKHFDGEGLHFNYISPINEPQWDWSRKYKEADQEGSPWTNDEIFQVTKALNSSLEQSKLTSEILITEAGMLNYLYGGSGKANHQIQSFFNKESETYLGNLSHVPKMIAGHSYFSESNHKTLIETRTSLADTVKKYQLKYWQSEYSMLGDGFKDGQSGSRTAIDCALFLSKVIHVDLTVGNATAWQFWNSYEPGSAEKNTRYYLIALQPQPDFKDGEFTVTKNLWALGHFSRFIRPGMVRIPTSMISEIEPEKGLFVSAFKGEDDKLVFVITNYGESSTSFVLDFQNAGKKYQRATTYLTSGETGVDMKYLGIQKLNSNMIIPARSIQTILMD